MSTFLCRIVTPSEELLNQEVRYVSFQASDGQQGVMRGASAFLSKLGGGSCRIDTGEGSTSYVLSGGFAQMSQNTLVLLADGAEAAQAIDADEAQKRVTLADAKVNAPNEKPLTLAQREVIENEQSLARARLSAARQR